MTTAIAIISILSSAIVAVAVTILSARLARGQHRIEASITRLDELRGVIDTAALQLRDALYDANGVWSLLADANPDLKPQVVLKEFEEHLGEMDDSKTRMDVRLGRTSALAQQYQSCRDPLWKLWEQFVGVSFQGRDFDATETERLLEQAAEERDLFLDAASALLGPELTLAATSASKATRDHKAKLAQAPLRRARRSTRS